MFGEEKMYGVKESQQESKGRIYLPKFTYAESGDELLLLQYDKKNEVILKKDFDRIIENLYEKYNNSTNTNERKKILQLIKIDCSKVIATVKVYSKNKINISKFGLSKNVRIIGCGTSILIENAEDTKKTKTK